MKKMHVWKADKHEGVDVNTLYRTEIAWVTADQMKSEQNENRKQNLYRFGFRFWSGKDRAHLADEKRNASLEALSKHQWY